MVSRGKIKTLKTKTTFLKTIAMSMSKGSGWKPALSVMPGTKFPDNRYPISWLEASTKIINNQQSLLTTHCSLLIAHSSLLSRGTGFQPAVGHCLNP